MPKNYVINMRQLGHDDLAIMDEMIRNGWHPTQVEELFLSIGPIDIIDEPTLLPEHASIAVSQLSHPYNSNPFKLYEKASRTIKSNPKILIIGLLSSISLSGATLIGAWIILEIFQRFAAILLFGLGSVGWLSSVIFITLLYFATTLPITILWSTTRTLVIRASLISLQSHPLNASTLFNGALNSILRSVGGRLILDLKLGATLIIPVTVAFIVTAETNSPFPLPLAILFWLISGLIINLRNTYLPLTLVAETNTAITAASKRSYQLLIKPQNKMLDLFGWLGSLMIAIAAIVVLSSQLSLAEGSITTPSTGLLGLIFSSFIGLSGVNILLTLITTMLTSIALLVYDIGLSSSYLGARNLEASNNVRKSSNIVCIVIIIIAILSVLLASSL